MPAGSEPTAVALPHTFRPLGVRIAAVAFGGLLFATAAAVWLAFPPEVREQFTTFQRLTVFAIGLAFGASGYALARSRVEARDAGVKVVNGYRSREFEWNEILAITMRPGSPWATLDLSDGTSVAAMGIQGSDGPRAVRQVKQIRALVEQQSRTERND
jgi:hypothetical protein